MSIPTDRIEGTLPETTPPPPAPEEGKLGAYKVSKGPAIVSTVIAVVGIIAAVVAAVFALYMVAIPLATLATGSAFSALLAWKTRSSNEKNLKEVMANEQCLREILQKQEGIVNQNGITIERLATENEKLEAAAKTAAEEKERYEELYLAEQKKNQEIEKEYEENPKKVSEQDRKKLVAIKKMTASIESLRKQNTQLEEKNEQFQTRITKLTKLNTQLLDKITPTNT